MENEVACDAWSARRASAVTRMLTSMSLMTSRALTALQNGLKIMRGEEKGCSEGALRFMEEFLGGVLVLHHPPRCA